MSTRSVSRFNTNWLSTISLILMCAMVFLTFADTALACNCDDLYQTAMDAIDDWEDAIDNYNVAKDALQNALDARPIDFNLINSANEVFDAAEEALENAENEARAAADAYFACVQECINSMSGGCTSGSCA